MTMPRLSALLLSALLLCACDRPVPTTAAAVAQEATATQGDFTVRASTSQTSMLSPGIARQYGLERSDNTVMLLVMTRRLGGGQEQAVPAKVSARVRDLRGQSHAVALRELRTQAGGETLVDYVGTVDVNLPETLSFELEVVPQGGDVMSMSFTRDFVPR